MIYIANLKKGEPYDLYIGRANGWLGLEGSKWANPFILKREGDREKILEQYKHYILESGLWKDLRELDDKVLGCYCSPKRCHGNILKELREEEELNELFL